MAKITEKIEEFALDFSRNAFFKSLAYGIIFSIIMTLSIGDIEKVFEFSKDFPFLIVKQSAFWVGIVFVSFSFLFAFFGYVSDLRSRDDILTPLRRKLVGYWEVRAEVWRIENDAITLGYNITHCTIGIEDIGRKLVMHFDISGSDVWADHELNVTHITLSYQGEPRQLIYFHEFELNLVNPINDGQSQIAQRKFPFLGVLNIQSKDEEVKEMSGRWYDIDNTIYNLARHMPNLAGLQDLTHSIDSGKITFRGTLKFKRLPKLPGI